MTACNVTGGGEGGGGRKTGLDKRSVDGKCVRGEGVCVIASVRTEQIEGQTTRNYHNQKNKKKQRAKDQVKPQYIIHP